MDCFPQILKCKTKDDILRLAKLLGPLTSDSLQRCKTKKDYEALVAEQSNYFKLNPLDSSLIYDVAQALRQSVAKGMIRFASPGYVTYSAKDLSYQFSFYPEDVVIRICDENDNEPDPEIIKLTKSTWLQSSAQRKKKLVESIAMAVLRNDPPSLQCVLQHNEADPNDAIDNMQNSILCQACCYGFNRCAHLLVEHGANVNHRGNAGRTPLYYACGGSDSDLSLYLLEHGADPNPSCDYDVTHGVSPLHLAASRGDLVLIRALSSRGANVNAMAIAGNGTPIHYAGRSRHLDRAMYEQVVAELTRIGGRDDS